MSSCSVLCFPSRAPLGLRILSRPHHPDACNFLYHSTSLNALHDTRTIQDRDFMTLKWLSTAITEAIAVYASDSTLADGRLDSVPYEPVTKVIQIPI
jgi:hypothetical protein